MLTEKLKNRKVILASQSPRRQKLLSELGIQFEVMPVDVDESFPAGLRHKEIAIYLSELKARAFDFSKMCENCLVITADTIVWKNNGILEKPVDRQDGFRILKQLSGEMHEVITAFTLRDQSEMKTFHSLTKVFFKKLTDEEILYYLDNFNPYDKAGAYGAQEWIGYIGIERIEGCYFNVVGLPLPELYVALNDFLQ
jgi:septum formation protein